MKFATGQTPVWKGKPKSSPLDDDEDFQKLVTKITTGAMKPLDGGAGLYINQVEDGKRLPSKEPGPVGEGPPQSHLRGTQVGERLSSDLPTDR